MKGNPTLNDVTEMADVSIATVSRVLNQNGYISSENRLKIEAAITTPGYRGRSSNKTFKRKKAG
ncbi:LacI family DNA-binding transcriptional regulator [Lachnospiraceae bacterium 54-11]